MPGPTNRSKPMNKGASPSVQKVCGRTLITVLSTAATVVPIQPSSFVRVLAMGDVFEFYRFTKLRVQLPPMASSSTSTQYAVGYSNQTFDTAPTLVAQVIELPFAARQTKTSTVFQYFKVGRNELLANAPLKWYKTVVGTPDALFETQGNLYCVSTDATAGCDIQVEWEVEFSQWNLAAQSPMVSYEPILGTDLFRKKKLIKPAEDSAAIGRTKELAP